jgi:hypothetical protein
MAFDTDAIGESLREAATSSSKQTDEEAEDDRSGVDGLSKAEDSREDDSGALGVLALTVAIALLLTRRGRERLTKLQQNREYRGPSRR